VDKLFEMTDQGAGSGLIDSNFFLLLETKGAMGDEPQKTVNLTKQRENPAND